MLANAAFTVAGTGESATIRVERAAIALIAHHTISTVPSVAKSAEVLERVPRMFACGHFSQPQTQLRHLPKLSALPKALLNLNS
jgi:hypothetical protein